MSSKNELGKFWVLGRVAHYAKHLNVRRISSEAGCGAVRFDMVALQILLCTALLAYAAFLHNLADDFSDVVLSFACAAVPFVVRRAAQFFPSGFCRTGYGAVLACAATSLTNFKLFSTLLAHTLKHSLRLTGFELLGAMSRTSVGFPTNVRVWSAKNVATRGASKRGAATPCNLSLEFGHG